MPKADFDAFVKRQQIVKRETEGIDWNKQRDQWLEFLQALYKQVSFYMQSYVRNNEATIKFTEIKLNEENIGSYTTNQMYLIIGQQQIVFTPIGTLIIGAKGRVDVSGPAGKVRLMLVNNKVRQAADLIRVGVHDTGRSKEYPRPTAPTAGQIEWVWKIIPAPPEVKFTALTEESFFDMILDVVHA